MASQGDIAKRLLRAHQQERRYDDCIAAAAALRVPNGVTGTGEEPLLVLAALALAETFGLLTPERGSRVTALVRRALAGEADASLETSAPGIVLAWCAALAEWCERNGEDVPFHRLRARAEAEEHRAAPADRVHWHIAAAWHHEAFGRRRDSAELLGQAETLALQGDAEGLAPVVRLHQARLALVHSDAERARALADAVLADADPVAAPLRRAGALDVRGRLALLHGDAHEALHDARRAFALAEAGSAPPAYTVTYRLIETYALLALGAFEDASALGRALAEGALPRQLSERLQVLASLFELARADATGWRADDDERLAAAMGQLRELQWPGVFALQPRVLARLWARALHAGVEEAWIRASIRSRRLPPPEPSWPHGWPWAVRVRVLGAFACEVDGQTLSASPGRVAARPLMLLRRLAAEAGHEPMPVDAIAYALWPGEGREGRYKALETTLARLRRLLGHADAVLLSERRLRLNPERVWLDHTALLRELDRIEGADDASESAWASVLALYRGPLLSEDEPEPWLRERGHALHLRLAAALARAGADGGHRARVLRLAAVDPALRELV